MQLASLSGVSRSILNQIERGQANTTLAVAFRIAQGFGMSIGELVEQAGNNPIIDIVHGEDTNNLFRSDKECQIRTLSPLHMEKNVEFYELRIAPHAQLKSAAHFDGAKELFTVTQGSAKIESSNSNCLLSNGDSAHYRADLEHAIINNGDEELVGYLVVTYQ
ncbi:MAG: transcriptional regulator with XRE-family HTH domain [Cellvibrionaceae bacterium]|jgi:transcriptional regulator with XRE-family HTH domain